MQSWAAPADAKQSARAVREFMSEVHAWVMLRLTTQLDTSRHSAAIPTEAAPAATPTDPPLQGMPVGSWAHADGDTYLAGWDTLSPIRPRALSAACRVVRCIALLHVAAPAATSCC